MKMYRLSVLTLLCLTAHTVTDRGGLSDEGFDKMAANDKVVQVRTQSLLLNFLMKKTQ